MPGDLVWEPLLEGVQRRRAEDAVLTLGDLGPASLPDASLGSGTAGLALFRAYLAELEDDGGRRQAAVDLAVEAMAQAIGGVHDVGLFAGVTGPAWVLAHLDGWLVDLGSDDPNDALDIALVDFVTTDSGDLPYDLVLGTVGVGVYALERLPRTRARRLLDVVIERLGDGAVHDEAGVRWLTHPSHLGERQRELAPDGAFDLGVAHGAAGVVALLDAARQVVPATVASDRLQERATEWVLRQELPDGGFPAWLAPGVDGTWSESAWADGVAAIALVLWRSATTLGRDDLARSALSVAAQAADHAAGLGGAFVGGICHGSAGLAHVYNRLWQCTGDARFATAARTYVDRTLEVLPAVAHGELLNGRVGIGLVLLAALGVAPSWDRALLLPG